MEEVVLVYPEQGGAIRAKVPVLRGLVIEAPDRALVEHLAGCAIARCRPGREPVFIDVSPAAAVEPNPWLDTLGIFADDPTWDDFVAEIKAARAEMNARTFDGEERADGPASQTESATSRSQRTRAMQFTIILRPQANGSVEATVPAIPGIAVSDRDRERALDLARCAIDEALSKDDVAVVEVSVPVEPSQNPWIETAGMFAGDPTLERMLEEIYAARDAERPAE